MRTWVKTFQPQFSPMILDGSKTSTIRPFPKDGCLPIIGDVIDCRQWSGKPYRSPQIKIARFKIIQTNTVIIKDGDLFIPAYCDRGFKNTLGDLWAHADGFASFKEMYAWFEQHYKLPFKGVRIKWDFNQKV